ncbi:hypothetical protein [Bosea sp. (in: a-proteobacteria)]|uniref:hypothetical protein n=1 Tax=Bosea sp. (in: a-proteobacteria) TaxID=1871050 RepID=UPI003B3A4381
MSAPTTPPFSDGSGSARGLVEPPFSQQRFDTFDQWVSRASSWLTRHPEHNNTELGEEKGWRGHHFTAMCFDTLGRRCRNGGDMMRARDEGAFPVWWIWPDQIVEIVSRASLAKPASEPVGDQALHDALVAHSESETASAALLASEPAGGGVLFPRLTDAMIRAACMAHYGSDEVDGIAMTVRSHDYNFRQAFKRMWKGARKAALSSPASSPPAEAMHGPFGYLVIIEGLGEDEWYLRDDPEPASGYISLPMFTKIDPFKHLPEGSEEPRPAEAEALPAGVEAVASEDKR